jgi:hypothetical protein
MKADKVAMRIQQQVSGIRVEALTRGYAELEELRVVFDRIDPYPQLTDKFVGLMEKHSFYNTHASDDGGDFKMVFARATSLGIVQLERMARKSRAEIRQEAKRRVGTRNDGLPPLEERCIPPEDLARIKAIDVAALSALERRDGPMRSVALLAEMSKDRLVPSDEFMYSLCYLRYLGLVETDHNLLGERTWEITPKGRKAFRQFFN